MCLRIFMEDGMMQTIVLRVANECNLRCSYCYDSQNHKNSLKQLKKNATDSFVKNKEQLIKDIRLLTKNAEHSVIIFHGGEPLLVNPAVLSEFCEEIGDFRFHIQTNATMIDHETIELFKRYHFHIGISLDGANEIQNRERIFLNGKSSFEAVMKKIHLLRDENIKFGVVMSINKNHIGTEKDLYDFLAREKLQCNIRPVFAKDDSETAKIMSAEEYIQFWCNLFDIWLEDEEKRVNSWQIQEFVQEICKVKIPDYREKGCECSPNCFKNFISLDIEGNLYPCNRLYCVSQFYYGNIRLENLEIINERIEELGKKRIKAIEKKCGGCGLYTYCYGGCPAEAYSIRGNLDEVSPFCVIRQGIYAHVKEKVL